VLAFLIREHCIGSRHESQNIRSLVFEIAPYFASDCADAFVKRILPITFAHQLQVVDVKGRRIDVVYNVCQSYDALNDSDCINLHTIRILFIIATINIEIKLAH
jgi:hypothetical protein